ncbi:hypothetical protein KCP71_20815 [Salmonella enterica subsp. enterica]|nr:hypothetical protein KCP71_20815 [Salmonella enterica subsp. enterica]
MHDRKSVGVPHTGRFLAGMRAGSQAAFTLLLTECWPHGMQDYRRHSKERCGHRTNDTDLHRIYG